VVIGILAVLLAILLPSVRRAREFANMMTCQSHLRQLDQAFLLYTQNNGDKFPRPALAGPLFEDWLYWQPSRVPNNPNQGRIQLYLGDTFDPSLYTCPSDDPNSHIQNTGYLYSYSVNFNLCADPSPTQFPAPPPYPPYPSQSRSRGQIVDPTHCILIIDESSKTVDDGCWAWQATSGSGNNVLSNRHDKFNLDGMGAADPNAGRGNVAFCDGHVELVPRVDTYIQSFWDPTYQSVHGGAE